MGFAALRMLLSLAVLLGALSAVFPGDAASFCGPRVVRDYEAPLRALPPANPVPRLLPFAPPDLEATAFRSVGERLVYRGSRPALDLRGDGTGAELNWTVKLLVSRPAADGAVGEAVTGTTAWVGAVGSLESVVVKRALVEPGSYRVDTTFESQAGALLGNYFEYIQVVPSLQRVRLALSRRTVAPGGSFKVRLENLGTRVMSYGYPYGLERHHAGRWRPVPQELAFLMPRLHLQPGQASVCQTVRVPAAAEPGLYRIRKLVSVAPVSSGSEPVQERAISKTFRVVARGKPTA